MAPAAGEMGDGSAQAGISDEGDEIEDFIVDDDGVPSKKKKKKRGMNYDDRYSFFISLL